VVLDDFTNRGDRLNSGDSRPDLTHGRSVADRAERVTGLRAERIEVGSLNEAALRQVVKDGAKVYVGAGNDFANQMCIDGVVCVGATDRFIGYGAPGNGNPAGSLVSNPRATAEAPGRMAVFPVRGEGGKVVGFDVDGDMKVDYGLNDLHDVSDYTQPVVGQPFGSALLTGPELRSVAAAMKRDGMTPALSAQLKVRIVNFAEVARLGPVAAKAFTPAIVPQGADPQRNVALLGDKARASSRRSNAAAPARSARRSARRSKAKARRPASSSW